MARHMLLHAFACFLYERFLPDEMRLIRSKTLKRPSPHVPLLATEPFEAGNPRWTHRDRVIAIGLRLSQVSCWWGCHYGHTPPQSSLETRAVPFSFRKSSFLRGPIPSRGPLLTRRPR